jgi:hypothetical protein
MLATLLLSCFIVFAADRPPTFDQRFGALPKSNMEPVIRMQHHFAPAGWPHNYRLA